MATDKQIDEKLSKLKKTQDKVEKKKTNIDDDRSETLVRILGYDIPGSRNLIAGLTRIKGVSWSISNAACLKLGFARTKKILELPKEDIAKIESFFKSLSLPDYLKNRRSDPETGEVKHHFGSDLDIKKEFDVKRLKEMRSYRGLRHALKLPVRGQRTRSHFRKKGIAMGVKRKK